MGVYAGRAAGSFGAAGGVIEFYWEPDPEVLARRIMQLSGYLENFKPPLAASRGVARADMQNHFDTESGPDGEAWEPLAPDTIATYGEHPILNLTGLMKGAATSDYAFPIDGNDLFFSTAGLPFYAMFHESGRAGSGAEPGFVRSGLEALAGAGITVTAEHKRALEREAAGGGAMPARPFIGISQAAQDLIIEVFDAWFEGGVSGFYVHAGTGTVQTLGPGGFGPGMTLSRE